MLILLNPEETLPDKLLQQASTVLRAFDRTEEATGTYRVQAVKSSGLEDKNFVQVGEFYDLTFTLDRLDEQDQKIMRRAYISEQKKKAPDRCPPPDTSVQDADTVRAKAVKEAATALNTAIREATSAGLEVRVSTLTRSNSLDTVKEVATKVIRSL